MYHNESENEQESELPSTFPKHMIYSEHSRVMSSIFHTKANQ